MVEWAVEIFNQHQQAVALYSILTLVARQRVISANVLPHPDPLPNGEEIALHVL